MSQKDGFEIRLESGITHVTLTSADGLNRLTCRKVVALYREITRLTSATASPLIVSGDPIFSAGADLNEIAQLNGPEALAFAKMGQALMNAIDNYPARVYACIRGFCMGGGLDLALACDYRIAALHTVFGHRGAALGLMTGWGGTQRLPRLVGKGRALEMFIAAEKVTAPQALRYGLIDCVVDDPVAEARHRIAQLSPATGSAAV